MSNKNRNLFRKQHKHQSRKLLLGRAGVVLVLTAWVAVPGFALAATTSTKPSANAGYQLSFSAAELKTMASAKALHLRIRRVALDYCPEYSVIKNLNERASCIKDVESDLVSKINHPLLTKIHSGKSGLAIASTNH